MICCSVNLFYVRVNRRGATNVYKLFVPKEESGEDLTTRGANRRTVKRIRQK